MLGNAAIAAATSLFHWRWWANIFSDLRTLPRWDAIAVLIALKHILTWKYDRRLTPPIAPSSEHVDVGPPSGRQRNVSAPRPQDYFTTSWPRHFSSGPTEWERDPTSDSGTTVALQLCTYVHAVGPTRMATPESRRQPTAICKAAWFGTRRSRGHSPSSAKDRADSGPNPSQRRLAVEATVEWCFYRCISIISIKGNCSPSQHVILSEIAVL